MNLRTFGKIGFLLVIIGFFMPIACDMNGFELASNMSDRGETFTAVLFYILFISAIIGFLTIVPLLQKKDGSIALEWLCLFVCIGSGLIIYFTQLEGGPDLQNGAYTILTGWIVAFIGQIIHSPSSTNSTNSYNRSSDSSNRKCRQCGAIYSGSYSSCPKCKSSLYEETNQSINNSSTAPINANYGDTWTCKKCNEVNPNTRPTCKGCGEYK